MTRQLSIKKNSASTPAYSGVITMALPPTGRFCRAILSPNRDLPCWESSVRIHGLGVLRSWQERAPCVSARFEPVRRLKVLLETQHVATRNAAASFSHLSFRRFPLRVLFKL